MSFDSVKSTTLVDHQKFQDFDSVMQLYVNFKRAQKSETSFQGCNVSALKQGCGGCGQGCRGASRGCGGGGCGGPNSRAQGLISQDQEGIDKVTNIENKHYPKAVYDKFSPAQKAKHWQLRNPNKTPRTGPAKSIETSKSAATVAEFTSFVSSTVSAISELTAPIDNRTAANNVETKDEGQWGRDRFGNPENPSLAHQKAAKKQKN